MFTIKLKPTLLALALSPVIGGCGAGEQNFSELEQHIRLSQTAQSTADTQEVYEKLRAIHDSVDGLGTMSADQLFSILSMKSSERQRIATSYSRPLDISCRTGLCTIAGQGRSVSVQTEVSGGGISRPTLVLDTAVKGIYMFTAAGVLRACNMSGVSVRKLFVTKQVQGVEVSVDENSVDTVVDAGDSNDNFDCRN